MNISKKGYFQLGFMIFLTLIIQALSLIKASMIASYFGVSYEMDAYNFVNSIATFF